MKRRYRSLEVLNRRNQSLEVLNRGEIGEGEAVVGEIGEGAEVAGGEGNQQRKAVAVSRRGEDADLEENQRRYCVGF
ncbi:hypothetical protein LXL04_003734 [Taraxacum kok-saghyz]